MEMPALPCCASIYISLVGAGPSDAPSAESVTSESEVSETKQLGQREFR